MSFSSPWRGRAFSFAVSIARRVLRPFGTAEDALIRGLVEENNRRVTSWLDEHPCHTLLLIMPRCVRRRGCDAAVRESLDPCLDCHDCPLGDIARLTTECDVRALVAYRSHIAFDIARAEKPDLIIATACEDRLVKALRAVPEIPALLVPLNRHNDGLGRCRGATIDLEWITRQLRHRTRPARRRAGLA